VIGCGCVVGGVSFANAANAAIGSSSSSMVAGKASGDRCGGPVSSDSLSLGACGGFDDIIIPWPFI